MQRIAIMGGGDWADASCDLLNLPDDIDITLAEEQYRKWKKENWSPGNYTGYKGRYLNFAEWLRIFEDATDSDVIEVWEVY